MRLNPWTGAGVVGILAAVGAGGCADIAGPGARDGEVAIRFVATGARGGADLAAGGGSDVAQDLALTGSNGTLLLTDVWFVVDEFELKGDGDGCRDDGEHDREGDGGGGANGDDDDGEDEDCEDFELGPVFLQLPLDGAATPAIRFQPGAATYDELEFEIKRLDGHEDGDDEELLVEIRQRFAEWPRRASVLVDGTFTPTGGTARAFRVFIDAEIEIEMDLVPPIVVGPDEGTDVTVEVDPALWFRGFDGRVLDLSAFDWAATQRLLAFEFELERGFRKAEH